MAATLDADSVRFAAQLLDAADAIAVSSGAGMSAESGVPTFRDQDGHWSKFNPAELATPQAFERNPRKVWEWYRLRRAALLSISPHAGHEIIAKWERAAQRLTVITQNVDGLHHRAGSQSVIELHGRLDVARCVSCSYQVQGLEDLGEDPLCPECGRRIRPGVVWFGEMLPEGAFDAAVQAVEQCGALLVIGTSGMVQPAASLAEMAPAGGAAVTEINPNPTPISALASVSIRSGCRDALLAIDAARNATKRAGA